MHHLYLQAFIILLAFSVVDTGLALAQASKSHTPQTDASLTQKDGWNTGSPKSVGLDTTFLAELSVKIEDGTYPDVHSLLIVKDSLLVYERYFAGNSWDYKGEQFRGPWTNFDANTSHNMASVTKSITALLVGIAVDHGFLMSENLPLSSFFQVHADLFDEKKKAILLRHLLTMTSGLEWNEMDVFYDDVQNDIVQLFLVPDPIRYVLAKPVVADPDTRWYYNGGGTNLLGEVIQVVSGYNLEEFAKRLLFSPLGASEYKWMHINSSVIYASGDMSLRPRDMAKIGYLILNDGHWKGKQIVSADWIRKLTGKYVSFNESSGYGYHWWIQTYTSGAQAITAYYADGWGGQRIMCFPSVKMVVIFTGGSYTQQPQLDEIVTNYILPAIKSYEH